MVIYLNMDGILQHCKEIKTGVLLLIAPTGTGKTLGIRNLVLEHETLYGKTIMVQPTKMSSWNGSGSVIRSMTPIQLIRHFLYKKKFDCQTLVLDEVHTMCVEYHTILSLLQKTGWYQRIRVILMSATPNQTDLETFFPLSVYHVPVSSPFPIDIQYTPIPSCAYGFASYHSMLAHVKDLLQKHPSHSRVLVFLYTHDQCDKMSRELKSFVHSYHQGKTFALYGGMDKKEFGEWHHFLKTEEKFVVFATNVAETSITIPNLSLIIDFGTRCIQQNNRIIYNHCPQSNLVQRSGRTGRTCSGTVVRCMSHADFLSRPERDHPEYNWDMIVLTILRSGHDPSHLLPDNVPLASILQKFTFYQLLDEHGNLNRQLVQFVFQSPLLLKNSCHLYYFLHSSRKHYHSDPQFVLYLLAIALIDFMETRMSRIYYYSSEDRHISKNRFLNKLKKLFLSKHYHDELVLYSNIFLSCMLNEKPVEFSNAFSLNFRCLRQISSSLTKLWHFVHPSTQETWQLVLKRLVLVRWEQDLEKTSTFPLYQLQQDGMEKLRYWFFINPLTPRFHLMNDLVWRPNFVVETHCIVSPFTNINTNQCILLLSYDDSEISQWFHPQSTISAINTLSFSLYTFLPSSMNHYILYLSEDIKMAFYWFHQFCKKKELVRKKFKPVLEDIQEDVAYRPGFWKMYQSIDHFLAQYQEFFQEKNNIAYS